MKLRLSCGLFAAAAILPLSPARADDGATRHCGLFQTIERQTSAGIGRMIDPVTRLAAIDLKCTDRLIHFRQQLTLPNSALKPSWHRHQQQHWSATYCRSGSVSAAAIRAGWTVATTITTSDGTTYRFEASCHEAEA